MMKKDMKKFQELQKNVDQKKKKETKKLPHMGTGNPHYDAKKLESLV